MIVFNHRIEFYNPGGLFGNLTIEELLSLNYKSQVRNKLIANAFKDIGKIEKYGTGMKRVFSICEDYGVVPPRFNNLGNGFEVVLFKKKLKDNDTDKRHDKILIIIKKNNKISISKLAILTKVSKSTILRDVKILKDKKLLKRVGKEKSGYWKVLEGGFTK